MFIRCYVANRRIGIRISVVFIWCRLCYVAIMVVHLWRLVTKMSFY